MALQGFEPQRPGRKQSAGCSLGAEFVLYNGSKTGAFRLLKHVTMAILQAPGLFTNGQVNR